jgi:hypothetical protein
MGKNPSEYNGTFLSTSPIPAYLQKVMDRFSVLQLVRREGGVS